MILIKFKDTFRDRVSEWTLAGAMLGWGLLVLISQNLFIDDPFFKLMIHTTSQYTWGTVTAIVGMLRITFLIINGAYRPSAHIRAIGCVLGAILWSFLFVSALSPTWVAPRTAIYGALLVLELISLWFAAGDAKLADLLARGKIRKT